MKNFMGNNKTFIQIIFITTLTLLNIKTTIAMNQNNYDSFNEISNYISMIEDHNSNFDDWLFSLSEQDQNSIKEDLYKVAEFCLNNYNIEALNNLPNSYFKRVTLNVALFINHNIFLVNIHDWNIERLEEIKQNLHEILNDQTNELTLSETNLTDDFLEIALEIIHRSDKARFIKHMFICKNPQLTTLPEIINKFVNVETLMLHTNTCLTNIPQNFGKHFPRIIKLNIDNPNLPLKKIQKRTKKSFLNKSTSFHEPAPTIKRGGKCFGARSQSFCFNFNQ